MDEQTWQGVQYLGNSVNASVGMLQAADLSRRNREFYEEQYRIQREYNTQEREAAQAYNTQEREAAQAWNEMMWNQTNAYNAPTAQMERMMAAGINPNNAAMAIGQSSTSASAPSSQPMSSPSASVSPPGMPEQYNPAQAMASMLNANATAQAAFSQARLNNAVAEKTDEETRGLVIDNDFKPFEKDVHLDYANTQIDYLVSQKQLSDESAIQIKEMLPIYKGKTVAEIQKMNAEIYKMSDERRVLVANRDYVLEQIKTEQNKRKLMDAQTYEAYMNGKESKSVIDLNGKREDLTVAEKYVAEQDKRIKELDANWIQKCQTDFHFDPRYDKDWKMRLLQSGVDLVNELDKNGGVYVDSTRVKMNGNSSMFAPKSASMFGRPALPAGNPMSPITNY